MQFTITIAGEVRPNTEVYPDAVEQDEETMRQCIADFFHNALSLGRPGPQATNAYSRLGVWLSGPESSLPPIVQVIAESSSEVASGETDP